MKIKSFLSKLSVLALVVAVLVPLTAQADQVTSRSVLLGSSGASAVTTHQISFTIPTAGNVGSIEFMYCTSAYSVCTKPTGLSSTAATLDAQSGVTGFTMNNGTDGMPHLELGSAVPVTGGTAVSYTLGNITNPSATNTEFYVRIETFTSTDATGSPVDSGVVAVSTANQIVVSGTMPESLVFCVGTTGTDCTNITGTTVDLGVFSPTATSTGMSIMSASTNASFGYAITLSGATMSSGSNTIPSMGTQSANSTGCTPSCTSAVGSGSGVSQFGTNVRANSSPVVGADKTGLGTAAGVGGYNSVNNFRFFTGDTIASATGPTKTNTFTNSYLVNVSPDQAAGVYTSTLTYICTATF